MTKNTSGLRPLGRAVLLRLVERKKGLIVIPPSAEERLAMIETEMEVVEVGPECWPDEKQPRCKPGDIVMISRMAGWMAGESADGSTYRMVNDRDIFALVTGPRDAL